MVLQCGQGYFLENLWAAVPEGKLNAAILKTTFRRIWFLSGFPFEDSAVPLKAVMDQQRVYGDWGEIAVIPSDEFLRAVFLS